MESPLECTALTACHHNPVHHLVAVRSGNLVEASGLSGCGMPPASISQSVRLAGEEQPTKPAREMIETGFLASRHVSAPHWAFSAAGRSADPSRPCILYGARKRSRYASRARFLREKVLARSNHGFGHPRHLPPLPTWRAASIFQLLSSSFLCLHNHQPDVSGYLCISSLGHHWTSSGNLQTSPFLWRSLREEAGEATD